MQGYKALQLMYFFTAGPDEVKAWTIQKGTKAPQPAGRIHTDFEMGFIMAEVMKFEDFKEEGSEAAAKVSVEVARLSHFSHTYDFLICFMIRRLESTGNKAGTTSWTTATSSSSSSTPAPASPRPRRSEATLYITRFNFCEIQNELIQVSLY